MFSHIKVDDMKSNVLQAWLEEMAKVDMESKISENVTIFYECSKNHFNIEIVNALKRLIFLYSLTHIRRRVCVCVCAASYNMSGRCKLL